MNTQKYIGTVLWFGTANGAKYGFIKYNDEPGKNQSIFFHKNKISKPSSLNLHKFIKDQTVTFYIKESDKDNSKNEAYNILLLEDEEDKKFVLTIFFLLLNKDKHNKLYQNIRSTVKRNIDHYLQFNDILDQELLQIVSDNQKIDELSIFYNYISCNKILYNEIINDYTKFLFGESDLIIDRVLDIAKKFSKNSDFYRDLVVSVVDNLKSNKTVPFNKKSSLYNIIDIACEEGFDCNDIFEILKNQNLVYIKDCLLDFTIKLDQNKNFYFLDQFAESSFFKSSFETVSELKKLFAFLKYTNAEISRYQFFSTLFISKFKDRIEEIATNDFIKILVLLDNYELDQQLMSVINSVTPKRLLHFFYQDDFLNLRQRNKNIIIQKILNHDSANLFTSYDKLSDFTKRLNSYGFSSEKESFIKNLSVDNQILLWLDDDNDDIRLLSNYDLYTQNIQCLSMPKQQLFIKKIFYMIAKGCISKDLDDIVKINTNDYSTKIIFNLLEKVSDHERLNKNFLKYDLLSSLSSDTLINAPDILRVDGYFDLCHGRTCEHFRSLNSNPATHNERYLGDGNQINEKQYFYVREEIEYYDTDKQNVIICDGRWSIDKNGNLNLSEGKYHFMWCRNKVCFETTRVPKNIENWQEYSLIDLLNILKISYNPEQIEILYATINHINRFLSHMNCRSCGCLLKPQGSSNYSFYRVSSFYCDNNFCQNPDKDVYISHCSNGYCNGTIDSRNSHKCDNGWVICSECFACCDKERLDKRNKYRQYNRMSKINWITPNGHRGYSMLCPHCANPMTFKDIHQKQQEYNGVIQDFERLAKLDIPQNQKLVGNHGVKDSNKKWFVVYQRHLDRKVFLSHLYYWQSLGFNIVDFENKTKSNYLVTEPNNDKPLAKVTHFYCHSCDHSYNYTHEHDKYRAIKYWHSSELTRI